MKKSSLFILLSYLFISLGYAQAPDLIIKKILNAPTIDGVIDPVWSKIDSIPIDKQNSGDFGDATLTSYFKMTWNDTAFFILIQRSDDDFAYRWETGLQDWESDRDEIWIDVNVDTLADGRAVQDGYAYGHHLLNSIWDDFNPTNNYSWINPWPSYKPILFGYNFTEENTYVSEFCIPFSSLVIDITKLTTADSIFLGNAGVIIGLKIVNVDVDMYDSPVNNSFRKFMTWDSTGGVDGYTEMDDAARVMLSSEYADPIPVVPDLIINKFVVSPVIDGDVDPVWDLIEPTPIDLQVAGDYGDATLTSYFKMGWNDTALFVLVQREDDDFANQWETGLYDWTSDRDELYFDVNIDTLADGRGTLNPFGASYGHYQFTSIWVEGDQYDTTYWPQRWYHNAPYKFGYNFISEDVYISEYCFPFSSLAINTSLLPNADATFHGKDGVVFGFAFQGTDVDMYDNPVDQNQRKFMWWEAAECDGWENMDNAGLVLMRSAHIDSFPPTPKSPVLTIKKFGTTPVIDGKIDKIWNQIDATQIDMQVSGDYGNASVSSSFKMGWNDTALFVFVNRIDDDFANQWETGLNDWSSEFNRRT
jgi:hypothetical protein